MRLSVVLLCCAALGVIGGAALIGVWCIGLAIIADSLAMAAWALARDDGLPAGAAPVAEVAEVATLHSVLEKARIAP